MIAKAKWLLAVASVVSGAALLAAAGLALWLTAAPTPATPTPAPLPPPAAAREAEEPARPDPEAETRRTVAAAAKREAERKRIVAEAREALKQWEAASSATAEEAARVDAMKVRFGLLSPLGRFRVLNYARQMGNGEVVILAPEVVTFLRDTGLFEDALRRIALAAGDGKPPPALAEGPVPPQDQTFAAFLTLTGQGKPLRLLREEEARRLADLERLEAEAGRLRREAADPS